MQPPQAPDGWSLSSKGAQLLLTLISCGDFLTVPKDPLDALAVGTGLAWEG